MKRDTLIRRVSPRLLLALAVLAIAGAWLWWSEEPGNDAVVEIGPARSERSAESAEQITLDELLTLAAEAREHVVANLDDYTAKFVKQERAADGTLGEPTVMQMKVQTRHRGGREGAPMRVYLKFLEPEKVAGREVLWAEDLRDGKLVVREAGLLGMVPIPPLDPRGMIAMRDQRYPIMEIGLTKLIEKLIERGAADRDSAGITVTLNTDHRLDETPVWLIQIERSTPVKGNNDFSSAEILFDPERKLVLSYRSFGWPASPEAPPPLIESYTYHDVRTNVGLTDFDFDPENPEYTFP